MAKGRKLIVTAGKCKKCKGEFFLARTNGKTMHYRCPCGQEKAIMKD